MNINRKQRRFLNLGKGVSLLQIMEDEGVRLGSQRCLNFLKDELIEPRLFERNVSFLQTKVFAAPNQILVLGCLWSISTPATAHIIMMFTKMYKGKSAAPAMLCAYLEENQKTISLTEVVIAIIGYDLPMGKMFSFATPFSGVDGAKYYLSYIHGEQFGKLLVSMPVTDLLTCHPDNYWVHAA